MGQAKNRGTLAARQAEAIEAGRVKNPTTQAFHSAPQFTLPDQKPSLVHDLILAKPWSSMYADSEISSKPPEPFHQLSRGAERTPAEMDAYIGTQGDLTV